MPKMNYNVLVELAERNSHYAGETVAMFKYLPDAEVFAQEQFNYYCSYYDSVTVTILRDNQEVRKYLRVDLKGC